MPDGGDDACPAEAQAEQAAPRQAGRAEVNCRYRLCVAAL